MAVVMGLGLAACGKVVEVPPATYGKILTKNGYLPDVIAPSKFRLNWCWAYCDALVVAEAQDKGYEESFTLFMPKDQLNLSFDVRFTLTVKEDYIDSILDRIISDTVDNDSQLRIIPLDRVYETYGQPVIRTAVREVMADYTIDQLLSSRQPINIAIRDKVVEALKNTPISVKTFSIADMTYPEIIVKQKEVAAQRRIDKEREEANKEVALIKAEADLEVAKANRAIRRENAQAALEENQIIAQSVTKEYLDYRRLEVLDALAKNGNAVFVPFSSIDDLGFNQRIYQDLKQGEAMVPMKGNAQ